MLCDLSVADLAAMEELYGLERDSAFFDPATVDHGVYFGVYEGASLVAMAGTHAWSKHYRIGAVGGVFTHPDHRGQGLAQVTTGAVTKALLEAGVEDVVLNVRTDNLPGAALLCASGVHHGSSVPGGTCGGTGRREEGGRIVARRKCCRVPGSHPRVESVACRSTTRTGSKVRRLSLRTGLRCVVSLRAPAATQWSFRRPPAAPWWFRDQSGRAATTGALALSCDMRFCRTWRRIDSRVTSTRVTPPPPRMNGFATRSVPV